MLRPVTAAVLALLAGAVLAQPSEPLQLQATPLLAEKLPDNAHPPTIVYGDRISGRTDFDHSHSTYQLGQAFLELFTIIIRGGVFNLGPNLGDSAFDLVLCSGAFNNGGVIFVDIDSFGASKIGDSGIFQFKSDLFTDNLTAGQDGYIFQHGFTAIAESRGFNGTNFQSAPQLVDHQGGQGFAFNIFGNDQ